LCPSLRKISEKKKGAGKGEKGRQRQTRGEALGGKKKRYKKGFA